MFKKDFDVFLPIDKVLKNNNGKDNDYIIAGYASTPSRDFQGEVIDPSGIDASYLFNNGWVDYEHDTNAIIGVPTENSYVDPDRGLYVEARLFGDDKRVQDIMKLYKDIQRTGVNRNLGFSIEGNAIARDDFDDSVIRQVQITGVAVTTHPANPNATWEQLQKSLSKSAFVAGYGVSPETQTDGSAVRVESFVNHLRKMATMLGEIKDHKAFATSLATYLDDHGISDTTVNTLMLQSLYGMSAKTAQSYINGCLKKHD